MITFYEPEFLWLLLGIPLVIYGYHLARKKRSQNVLRFSQIGLLREAAGKKNNFFREHLLFSLVLLVIISMILGFADPHIPLEQEKEGVSVVLSIDVSGSMTATDYPPNRIEAAKSSAKILVESLKPKDHAGIVVFETGATTSAFLSPDKKRVIQKLEGISVRQGRTAIGDGLALAVDMAISIPNKQRIVILLSDGVNNAGAISPEEAIGFAKANDIQVFTIGMGSNEPVVLGYDWFGNPQYAEFDENLLKLIAQETNGKYYRSVDKDTLDNIYKQISSEIKREKEEVSIKDWFFAAAALILLLEIYVRYGRYKVM